MDDLELQQKGRRLVELRQKRDQAKRQFERDEEDYREAEAEFWEALDESPVEGSRKVDLGPPFGTVTFTPTETYYGNVIDEQAALEYLEERALIDEYTHPKLKKARVNELIRELREQGAEMPPGFDFYPQRRVRITMPK